MLSPRSLGVSGICLSLLLVAACGDDEGDKSSGTTTTARVSGDAGKVGIDLTGLWASTDFECRSSKRRETLQIDQRDVNVTGTKVFGDDCVPAGYVSFEGKLPRAEIAAGELPVSFPVKLYGGDPGAPDTIGVSDSGTAKITSPNSISLQLSRSTIVLTRSEDVLAAGSGGAGGDAAAAGRGGAGTKSVSKAGTGGSGGAGESAEEAGAGAGGGGAGGTPGGRVSASGRAGAGGRSGSGGGGSGGRPAAGSGGAGAGAGAGGAGAGGMSEEAGSGGAGGAAANCRGPLLPGATCDHVQQCGCKTDETCQFYGAEPPRCQAAGPQANGELCETNPDCGAGLLCVNGICRHNCRADSDCSGPCIDATYDDMTVEGLKFCLDPCDPVLARDCTSPRNGCGPCAQGSTCLPSAEEGFAYCMAPDLVLDREPGAACTKDEECFGGGCKMGKCHRWCQEDSDCDETETCKPSTGQFIKQGLPLGYCALE